MENNNSQLRSSMMTHPKFLICHKQSQEKIWTISGLKRALFRLSNSTVRIFFKADNGITATEILWMNEEGQCCDPVDRDQRFDLKYVEDVAKKSFDNPDEVESLFLANLDFSEEKIH